MANIKLSELRQKDVIELPADRCLVLEIKDGGSKSLSSKKTTTNITVRMLSGPFKGTEGTFLMVSDDDVNVIKRYTIWNRIKDWFKSFKGRELVFKQKKKNKGK